MTQIFEHYPSLCAYQLTHQNKPTIQIKESSA